MMMIIIIINITVYIIIINKNVIYNFLFIILQIAHVTHFVHLVWLETASKRSATSSLPQFGQMLSPSN